MIIAAPGTACAWPSLVTWRRYSIQYSNTEASTAWNKTLVWSSAILITLKSWDPHQHHELHSPSLITRKQSTLGSTSHLSRSPNWAVSDRPIGFFLEKYFWGAVTFLQDSWQCTLIKITEFKIYNQFPDSLSKIMDVSLRRTTCFSRSR